MTSLANPTLQLRGQSSNDLPQASTTGTRFLIFSCQGEVRLPARRHLPPLSTAGSKSSEQVGGGAGGRRPAWLGPPLKPSVDTLQTGSEARVTTVAPFLSPFKSLASSVEVTVWHGRI